MLHPDTILLNGKIATLDGEDRFVSALASHAGRIVALGSDHDVRSLAGRETRTIDLHGSTAIPGVVDSHCHPDAQARRLARWVALSPDRVRSRAEVLDAIGRMASKRGRNEWIGGYRFDERKSGGYPTLAELDCAAGGRPLFILRTDGHLGLANSRAFAECGIGSDAADPPFGRFDREPGTRAFTGLVRESAAHLFLNTLQAGDTVAHLSEGLQAVFDEFLSVGITSAYNSLAGSTSITAFQEMKRSGALKLRVGVIASGREDGLIEALIAAGLRSGFGDDLVRLIAVEWCPDCSTSGRTAAYYEPYVGAKVLGEPEHNTGMLLYEKEDLSRRAALAHKAGLQVCIEGVGDRGIDFALDCIEAALEAHPVADHRMRVEHCCYVTPPILKRMKRLGAVDSSATGFMYELGDAYRANRGEAAMRWMWPHRSLIDAGVPAPGHSDAYICRPNPFQALWSMVNRKTETSASLDVSEAVTVIEALRAYTVLGAWSGREEAIKGSLELGKLADVAILDRDLFTIPPDEIREVRVDMTLVGGSVAYERER